MKTLLPLCSILAAALHAAELPAPSDAYLSEPKREQLRLEQERIDAEASTLRDSWIMPVTLKYTHSKSDPYGAEQTTKTAAITIDQPIFRSGGIIFGVLYAGASRDYSNDTLEQQRRSLIKQTVALLMQIRQSDLRIARQQLLIDNAQINLEQKREQYVNGQIDSGYLNTAMVEANAAIQTLYDLQTSRERLASSFRTLSDLDPETALLPTLQLIGEEDFLAYNIDIKAMASEARMDRYHSYATYAKYLPQVNLFAGYTEEEAEGSPFFNGTFKYHSSGFRVTMPLDINTFSDIEATRVKRLQSEVILDDTRREQRALFEQVSQNLKNYRRKIDLAHSNQMLYGEILQETRELYGAGYRTEFDVRNMENSVAVQELDTRIYEFDRQLELLNLYEKIAPLNE